MKISFLLGAGFSIPAGYPSGKKLNEKFFYKVGDNIARKEGGEWIWKDEHPEFPKGNLRNEGYLGYPYLIEALIEEYQKEDFMPFDYEEFYTWFYGKKGDYKLFRRNCELANKMLKKAKKLNKDSDSKFQTEKTAFNDDWEKINEIYNQLISDLLRPSNTTNGVKTDYRGFFNYILDTENEVNIFSLNHDRLVEEMFEKKGIQYSDGFTTKNSNLEAITGSGKALPIFQEDFSKRVNLIKLHGSVDYLNYVDDDGNNGFYKPNFAGSKHRFKIKNSTTRKVEEIQPNSDIIPLFLTGKSKEKVITKHFYYKPVFEQFNNSFKDLDKLIVIGYSYSDIHVNKILKKAVDNYPFKVINVNPSLQFPFKRNFSRDFIEQKNDINEL